MQFFSSVVKEKNAGELEENKTGSKTEERRLRGFGERTLVGLENKDFHFVTVNSGAWTRLLAGDVLVVSKRLTDKTERLLGLNKCIVN